MEIRGMVFSHASCKKKERDENEKVLIEEINVPECNQLNNLKIVI